MKDEVASASRVERRRWGFVVAAAVAAVLATLLVLRDSGHDYSSEQVRRFVSDCESAGISSSSCRCLVEDAESSLAYSDLRAEAQAIFDGGSSDAL